MNVFILAGIVGIAVILVGVLVAGGFFSLSRLVTANQAEVQEKQRGNGSGYNPAETLGYEIPVEADAAEQLRAARRLAAQQASLLPRGANMRIGRLGASNMVTASNDIERDPWTATKIALFHTWQGAKVGPPAGGVPAAPPPQPAAKKAAPTKKPEDLVPGVDYPFIEITDDMDAAEVRKARIANAKARSQAVKALKEQAPAAPAADVPAGAPVAAEAEKASPVSPAATGVPAPDYIEITDDMEAAEVRKARIHNAKARSAYNKALKEAGIDPSQVTAQKEEPGAAPAATAESAEATRPAEPTPASGREAVAVPEDIPQPDYIEITDDMSSDEVRRARVHNAKARSAFYKALKERGIDPQELEAQQAAVADAAAEASQEADETAPAEPASATPPAPAKEAEAAGGVKIPAGVEPPNYTEITDDMSADEVRRARVDNAKERSRFFRELKEAGIDPKEVDI